MDYHKKYLKYKLKYLNLLKGGGSDVEQFNVKVSDKKSFFENLLKPSTLPPPIRPKKPTPAPVTVEPPAPTVTVEPPAPTVTVEQPPAPRPPPTPRGPSPAAKAAAAAAAAAAKSASEALEAAERQEIKPGITAPTPRPRPKPATSTPPPPPLPLTRPSTSTSTSTSTSKSTSPPPPPLTRPSTSQLPRGPPPPLPATRPYDCGDGITYYYPTNETKKPAELVDECSKLKRNKSPISPPPPPTSPPPPVSSAQQRQTTPSTAIVTAASNTPSSSKPSRPPPPGTVNDIIIAVTHNNRLQCFFTKVFKHLLKDKAFKNLKFKHCAVIRCYRVNNNGKSYIKFEMIYEGELEDKKGKTDNDKYWTKETFNSSNISTVGIDIDKIEIKKQQSFTIPYNKEIYFVRHGEGIHNISSKLEKSTTKRSIIKDAELSTNGSSQAFNAADNLKRYFTSSSYGKSKYHFAASHLRRSMQTAAIFQNRILKESEPRQEIVIIPCIHELLYNSSGLCDSQTKKNTVVDLLSQENVPSCIPPLTHKSPMYCTRLALGGNYSINWDKYNDFYNSKSTCEDTNMIEQILKVLTKS